MDAKILIGSGAQADVYLFDNKAVKIFKEAYAQADAHYEADIHERVYQLGLPVPRIYEVKKINGQMAIIMEYIEGVPLGTIMLNDMENINSYLKTSVNIQLDVNARKADGFPKLNDKLIKKIKNTPLLDDKTKNCLVKKADALEIENKLCHGDFHVLNLIKTFSDIKIIDWMDASSGSAAADACRTYLLYLLYRNDVADLYMNMYCSESGINRDDVISWLPVVAGARLDENTTDKDIKLLLSLINIQE